MNVSLMKAVVGAPVWSEVVMTLQPPWRCTARPAAAYSLSRATWHELLSNLWVVATCAGRGNAQERPGCELRLVVAKCCAWGGLPRVMKHCESICYLFWGLWAFERFFLKVCSMSQDKLLVWKHHWKQLGWASKLDGVGSQGIT